MELKTKHLRIVALTIEQMELLCMGQDKLDEALALLPSVKQADEHLTAAYREMYSNCVDNPDDYLWYTNWQIILTAENRSIGSIAFFGPANEKHETEIGFGIDKKYRNKGYATQALDKMLDWAFSKNVYYVQAKTESDNVASRQLLLKCGFSKIDNKGEFLLFEKEKPASSYMSIFMCLGIAVGVSIGSTTNNMGLWTCVGLAIGIAIGVVLDITDTKKRKRT